jgi:hypothetical protein
MTLEEMNNFIDTMKQLRQNGTYTKEQHIEILSNTDYRAGKWLNAEGVALIAQLKATMDAAIAEAQE